MVEASGSTLSVLECGALKTPAGKSLSECLRRLSEGIHDVIERMEPEAVAIEGVFFCKNVKTAVTLGETRGAAIAACARHDLPVYEYSPRRVKQAVVGFGSASKEQVRGMVMSMLGLKEEPQEDAGDALAIAICHWHTHTGHAALKSKEI